MHNLQFQINIIPFFFKKKGRLQKVQIHVSPQTCKFNIYVKFHRSEVKIIISLGLIQTREYNTSDFMNYKN